MKAEWRKHYIHMVPSVTDNELKKNSGQKKMWIGACKLANQYHLTHKQYMDFVFQQFHYKKMMPRVSFVFSKFSESYLQKYLELKEKTPKAIKRLDAVDSSNTIPKHVRFEFNERMLRQMMYRNGWTERETILYAWGPHKEFYVGDSDLFDEDWLETREAYNELKASGMLDREIGA